MVVPPEEIDLTVDLSSSLSMLFRALLDWLSSLFTLLDSVIIFSGVSLLKFLIAVFIIGLIISAVFVIFGGDDDD